MNHDDELDALLRSTLRSEAAPTEYLGGLDAPVFQGVRRRRRRRVVGTAAGSVAAIALVVGSGMVLDGRWGAGPESVQPAGATSVAGPTQPPTSTGPTTPAAPTSRATGPSATAPSATSPATTSGPVETMPATQVDVTAKDWSNLPTGPASEAWVAYSVDGAGKVVLDWDGKRIDTGIQSVANPQLRLAADDAGDVVLLVRGALAPGATPTSGEAVHLVRQDGSSTLLFAGVTGSTVTEPTGKGLTAAFLDRQGKVEVRNLRTQEVVSTFARSEGDTPMTWSKAGMMLKGGDVVDEKGAVREHVDGVRTASTAASTGTMYAVTDTSVIRVASTGTAKVGDARQGEGKAFAGASPRNTHLATAGGVMDLASGAWVIEASGTIDALQWADDTHVVFIRPEDNVRCDIVALRCERVERGSISPFSQLKN